MINVVVENRPLNTRVYININFKRDLRSRLFGELKRKTADENG